MSSNLPRSLLPFVIDNVEYVLFKELSEILRGDAHVNIVVDLYGNTNSVAFSNAEAARKDHLVLDVILGNCVFKQLNDLGRSLEMARGSNTNLNEQHGFIPLRELRY